MKIFAPVCVLLASSLILGTGAINCTRPYSPQFCATARFANNNVDRSKCEEEGGTYLEQGGPCGYLDLCAKYVGKGASCNTTSSSEYATPICEPPLLCTSRDGTGKCVKKCTRYIN